MKRIAFEALLVALIFLTGWGIWTIKERQRTSELEIQDNRWNSRLMTFQTEAERLQAEAGRKEGRAVFAALASGVLPLARAKNRSGLDQAVSAALEVPGIEALHVLGADGTVLAGSDRKLLTTGRLDPRDGWVLETLELTEKPGEGLELAAPLRSPSALEGAPPTGFLWLIYRSDPPPTEPATPDAAEDSTETEEED
ncbi:MAG: hypothetical protein AAF604_02975 [Acidobacteriota bacterium]